jgi:hypothetical protein
MNNSPISMITVYLLNVKAEPNEHNKEENNDAKHYNKK